MEIKLHQEDRKLLYTVLEQINSFEFAVNRLAEAIEKSNERGKVVMSGEEIVDVNFTDIKGRVLSTDRPPTPASFIRPKPL